VATSATAARANIASLSPMGREAVLTPVTWNKGDWPVFSQVRGTMSAWALPPPAHNIPGSGPFNGDPDNIDFSPDSAIPPHFLFNRYPSTSFFKVSPPGLVLKFKRTAGPSFR
jgi:beta-xylosidase